MKQLTDCLCTARGLQRKGYGISDQWVKFVGKGRKKEAFSSFCKKIQFFRTG